MTLCTLAPKTAGLGLRRELIPIILEKVPSEIDFFEVAPENWIEVGGKLAKRFQSLVERYPFVCHGLSLSLGGAAPLNELLLKKIKNFLNQYRISLYSEHLSYCGDHGYLYDLLPIPFTQEAVRHVSQRIRRAQDILERKIAIENVSYYLTPPLSELSEIEFLKAVLEEADCELLLDINNIYVNSVNHRYDSMQFLEAIPAERIAYFHLAGHYDEADDLKVDTHGSDVVDPVWNLLEQAYQKLGVFPTLLERDFNIPPLPQLLSEVSQIKACQDKTLFRTNPFLHKKRA